MGKRSRSLFCSDRKEAQTTVSTAVSRSLRGLKANACPSEGKLQTVLKWKTVTPPCRLVDPVNKFSPTRFAVQSLFIFLSRSVTGAARQKAGDAAV